MTPSASLGASTSTVRRKPPQSSGTTRRRSAHPPGGTCTGGHVGGMNPENRSHQAVGDGQHIVAPCFGGPQVDQVAQPLGFVVARPWPRRSPRRGGRLQRPRRRCGCLPRILPPFADAGAEAVRRRFTPRGRSNVNRASRSIALWWSPPRRVSSAESRLVLFHVLWATPASTVGIARPCVHDGRHEVDGVCELGPHDAGLLLDAPTPVDDERGPRPGPACVALPQLGVLLLKPNPTNRLYVEKPPNRSVEVGGHGFGRAP